MIERKWGRIINITGKSEPEGLNGAFAAKAAVHSWAKGLSREVGKHGITVNCVPPGPGDERPDPEKLHAGASCVTVRARDPGRTLRRARRARRSGRIPGIAARKLHHRRRDSRGRRP